MPANFSDNNQNEKEPSKVEEPHFLYGPSEEEQLLRALKRTHTERFQVMTKLMRMNIMLSKAKITHHRSGETDQPE